MRKVMLAPVRGPLSFWNGMHRLVGDLVLPPWPGPHPAALFVAGHGPGGRDQGTWPQRLAAAGFASLAYDRPGCGESTGDWSLQGLDDRVREVCAALAALREQPEVAADSIALIAPGEGGWVGLQAAHPASVAALVLAGTAAFGALALEQYRLAQRMSAGGFGPAEVGLAQALLRERVRRLNAGESATAVLGAEAACRRAGWYPLMPGASADEISSLAKLSRFDPGPALSALRAPVLALYGADDAELPVSANARHLDAVLASSGHSDHDVVIVPGADGSLRVPSTSAAAAAPGQQPPGEVAPGVFELIVTWLDRRLGRTRAGLALARG